MKKILYLISIVAISLVLFSCKSSKTVEDDGLEVTETVVDESSEKEVDEEEKQKEDKKDSQNKDDKKSKEKPSEDNTSKSYLGWIDAGVKNPVYEDGLVKIKSDSGLGTFGLYVINEEGKATPVISTLNEYSSTGFYLKAGRRVHKLISSKNVKVNVGQLTHGIGLFYDVKNTANVAVKFEAMPSLAGGKADTLKCSVEIKNSSKKTETYSIKMILDTVLGEKANYHFFTSKEMPVKREFSTRNLREDSWFVSKNDQASMQVLFNGGNITPPSLVALANYDTLANAAWEPNMLSERAFDTVLSYNNSAIGAIWPEVRLEPESTSKIVFYISLGLYGKTPTGHYFVNGIKPPAKPVEEPIIPAGTYNEDDFVDNSTLPDPVPVQVEKETPVVSENVYIEDQMPSIEFNIKKIPKDHLTEEYVQSLMNRINELDKADNPNRNEILQLNAELDAILSILRQ